MTGSAHTWALDQLDDGYMPTILVEDGRLHAFSLILTMAAVPYAYSPDPHLRAEFHARQLVHLHDLVATR